jgi:hypothetical protein
MSEYQYFEFQAIDRPSGAHCMLTYNQEKEPGGDGEERESTLTLP